jgi:hypothetical protein
MMEEVCASETLVNFNVTTRRYVTEDSKLIQIEVNVTVVSVEREVTQKT